MKCYKILILNFADRPVLFFFFLFCFFFFFFLLSAVLPVDQNINLDLPNEEDTKKQKGQDKAEWK